MGVSPSNQIEIRASSLARELQSLRPRARVVIGAVDEVIIVLDAVVMAANAFLDESDTRPWTNKVESTLNAFDDLGRTYGPRIADFLLSLDESKLDALAKKYVRRGHLDFVKRMIGQAAFHRLHVAVSEDFDVVAAAAYKGVESLMPYAVAIGDMAEALSEEQIAQFMDFNPAGGFMLEMVMNLLGFCDVAVDRVVLPEHVKAVVKARERAPDSNDMIALTEALRQRVSGSSREWVRHVSAMLNRKLQGACDAMQHSVDSVSQAANSLVEFIDRLLRTAFSSDEVLEWLAACYADSPGLTYFDRETGELRPSQRGRALCLTHAGQRVDSPSPIHLLAAASLIGVRTRLQKLKHADHGGPEELAAIDACVTGIEAFIHVGCQMAWTCVPDEVLQSLRDRLESSPSVGSTMINRETA